MARTTNTNEVIKALEETSIETCGFPDFRFTPSHDYLQTERIQEDLRVIIYFQWQNGQLVPVYPQEAMEKAGATYMFPDWPGPWNNIS